jgi:hypothetical protein
MRPFKGHSKFSIIHFIFHRVNNNINSFSSMNLSSLYFGFSRNSVGGVFVKQWIINTKESEKY